MESLELEQACSNSKLSTGELSKYEVWSLISFLIANEAAYYLVDVTLRPTLQFEY
jgi:hypothetical protein